MKGIQRERYSVRAVCGASSYRCVGAVFCLVGGQCLHAPAGLFPCWTARLSGSCSGRHAVHLLLRGAGGCRCCSTRGCRCRVAALRLRPVKEQDDCRNVIGTRLALQPQLVCL